jgi:hypothetical protein
VCTSARGSGILKRCADACLSDSDTNRSNDLLAATRLESDNRSAPCTCHDRAPSITTRSTGRADTDTGAHTPSRDKQSGNTCEDTALKRDTEEEEVDD